MLDIFSSKEGIAALGIIFTLIGYSQYFRSIFAGKTKPHMFSWLIWASLTLIAFLAQVSDNAGPGSWITALTAIMSFIIVGLSCFKGEKSITRGDWITFLTALTAIPIWLITDNPLWAVIIVTIIDALGFYPTFRKSWLKPFEENALHYFLAALKFILSLVALDNFSIITALYPASLVFMNFTFLVLLYIRRKQVN